MWKVIGKLLKQALLADQEDMLAALDRGAERVQGVRGGHSLDGGLARGWRGVGGAGEGLEGQSRKV